MIPRPMIAERRSRARVDLIDPDNYVTVVPACDRVSLIQDGVIALDKPTARPRSTSEEIVVRGVPPGTAAEHNSRGEGGAGRAERRRKEREG